MVVISSGSVVYVMCVVLQVVGGVRVAGSGDTTCDQQCTKQDSKIECSISIIPCSSVFSGNHPTYTSAQAGPSIPSNLHTTIDKHNNILKTIINTRPHEYPNRPPVTITWQLPRDSSYKDLTGFVLLITDLAAGFTHDQMCLYYNLDNTSWDVITNQYELSFYYDSQYCSNGLIQSWRTYYIQVYSLPLPTHFGIHFAHMFFTMPSKNDSDIGNTRPENWSSFLTFDIQDLSNNYKITDTATLLVSFTLAPKAYEFNEYTITLYAKTNHILSYPSLVKIQEKIIRIDLTSRKTETSHAFEGLCNGTYKVWVQPSRKNYNSKCVCGGDSYEVSCNSCTVTKTDWFHVKSKKPCISSSGSENINPLRNSNENIAGSFVIKNTNSQMEGNNVIIQNNNLNGDNHNVVIQTSNSNESGYIYITVLIAFIVVASGVIVIVIIITVYCIRVKLRPIENEAIEGAPMKIIPEKDNDKFDKMNHCGFDTNTVLTGRVFGYGKCDELNGLLAEKLRSVSSDEIDQSAAKYDSVGNRHRGNVHISEQGSIIKPQPSDLYSGSDYSDYIRQHNEKQSNRIRDVHNSDNLNSTEYSPASFSNRNSHLPITRSEVCDGGITSLSTQLPAYNTFSISKTDTENSQQNDTKFVQGETNNTNVSDLLSNSTFDRCGAYV